jgi:hypothetical protein
MWRQSKQILCSTIFAENHAVYEITWKNIVEPDSPKMTIQCDTENIQFARQITKARIQTYTHTVNTYCLFLAAVVT